MRVPRSPSRGGLGRPLLAVALVVASILLGAFAARYYGYTVTFSIRRLVKADLSFTIPETSGSTAGVYDPSAVQDALDFTKPVSLKVLLPSSTVSTLAGNYYRIMVAVWVDVDDDGTLETHDIDGDLSIGVGEVEQVVFVFVDINEDGDYSDSGLSATTVWIDFDMDGVEDSGESVSLTSEAFVWYDFDLDSAYDSGELVQLPNSYGRYEALITVKDYTSNGNPVTLVGLDRDVDMKVSYFTGNVDASSVSVNVYIYAVELSS